MTYKFLSLLAGGVVLGSTAAYAAPITSDKEFEEILSLDISDLVVTSASRRPQKLTDTPAAIYVITQEDLHRGGITSIPEALRMVPGVQVAQSSSSSWQVAARGFNSGLSNKLLVMIDGRSIYTPVFSGTYWQDQSVPIENIERIEVIRGPGASLWGANAVDGIINIITKHAADTQGNTLEGSLGSQEGGAFAQHGGKFGQDGYYRTYAQYSHYDALETITGSNSIDDWYRASSGFRMDGRASESNSYTVEGQIYGGEQGVQTRVFLPAAAGTGNQILSTDNPSFGGNILTRWNHEESQDSHMSLQAYVDHYARLDATASQHISSADLQFQHNLKLDGRNNFVWGAGARLNVQDLEGSFTSGVRDQYSEHEILSLFAQDEYALIPNTLYFTAGSKFEYNDFTGFEVEPSARLAWHPTDNQTLWGAISRAVRTPSSIEDDVSVAALVAPGTPPVVSRLVGNSDQKDEKLIAYELGHRIQPTKNTSFDSSVFFNNFTDLLTIGIPGASFTAPDGTTVIPYTLGNQGSGHVYGFEEAANWSVNKDWRLMATYSYLKMTLDETGSTPSLQSTPRRAPRNQFSLRSYLNLTDTVQWDNMLYYVSHITPPVKDYLRYDMRLGWQMMPGMELNLIGRNLLDPGHPEFTNTVAQEQIPRSVLAQVSWKF